jgi:hypothetical protein
MALADIVVARAPVLRLETGLDWAPLRVGPAALAVIGRRLILGGAAVVTLTIRVLIVALLGVRVHIDRNRDPAAGSATALTRVVAVCKGDTWKVHTATLRIRAQDLASVTVIDEQPGRVEVLGGIARGQAHSF